MNAKAVTVTVAGSDEDARDRHRRWERDHPGGVAPQWHVPPPLQPTYNKTWCTFAASGNPTDGAFTQANVPDGTYIGLFENCGANTSGTGPDYNYESVFYGPGSGGPFQPAGASTITVTNGATINLGTPPSRSVAP